MLHLRLQRAVVTRPLAAASLVAAAGLALWLAGSPPAAEDLRGDEGYHGVMARNVLADPRQLVAPSLTPLGPPGDRPAPYPAVLAVSLRALGNTEFALRLPSLLAAALAALAAGLVAGRVAGAWAAPAAALFLLTAPWFAERSRHAAGEIPAAALGAFALALTLARPLPARRAALAGALLGAAFLFGLWPAGLLLLPAVAAVWPRRGEGGAALAALLGAAAAVALAPGAAVALARPEGLGGWWQIYGLPPAAARVSAASLAGPEHSPIYYWNTLLRGVVLLLPLALVGAWVCVRRRQEPAPRALLVWAGGVLVLSAFPARSWAYLYPVVPAWAALAAVGAVALAARDFPPRWLVFAGAAAASPTAAELLGGPLPPAGPWALAWLVLVAALPVLRIGRRGAGVALAAVCLLPAVAGVAGQSSPRPRPGQEAGYRDVAAALASRLADAPPAQVSYLAPEAPALAFHLFRAGEHWDTPARPWSARRLAEVARDARLRAFVVDPDSLLFGGWPDSAALAWLADSTREITGEVGAGSARPSRLRVFVREGTGGEAPGPR